MEEVETSLIELDTWDQFESEIRKIELIQTQLEASAGCNIDAPLFRGLGDSKWGLETTLERSYPMERCDDTLSLRRYYRTIMAARSTIETLSGQKWNTLPNVPQFEELLQNPGRLALHILLSNQREVYDYLVHLRHHGFPSPLLDWSASPYVAAFFAFDDPAPSAERVSIFVLLRGAAQGGSNIAHLFVVGGYLHTHPRHLFQRCNYSMCVKESNADFLFCAHEGGIKDAIGPNGQLFKITLPVTQRLRALKNLDLMNVNAFSLFASEDSLVRTVSRRECLFRSW
jgi:hypothetical protein